MTAAARVSRYFVLVVDGQPYTQEGAPDVPFIFRDEGAALAASRGLRDWGGTVVLEAYADDYSFLGGRRLGDLAALTLRP